jgi:predicted cupin superfamily sugar epimerase
MDADWLIAHLGLEAHPEGGWFRETWRDQPADGTRGAGTAIHFLLRAGERSHWHRVDATEIWHHYAGGPLELAVSPDGREVTTTIVGDDLADGEQPQAVVPADAWQAARPLADWVLVGCTVSPAFEFGRFELAAPDWQPG